MYNQQLKTYRRISLSQLFVEIENHNKIQSQRGLGWKGFQLPCHEQVNMSFNPLRPKSFQ